MTRSINTSISALSQTETARSAIACRVRAFMNARTRQAIAERAVSVWLKADIDVLMERVMKNRNRPLLKTSDPRAVMERLMAERHPVYALADVTVQSRDEPKEVIAQDVLGALVRHLEAGKDRETAP